MRIVNYNHKNPIHRAIFLCVVQGGAGDCTKVLYEDDGNSGRVYTKKQYGAGDYKWSVIGGKVYCCRHIENVEAQVEYLLRKKKGSKIMAHILKVDGTKEELPNTKLETLQAAVGGYIQIIPTNDKRLMVLDEEGKLKGYQHNPHADLLARGLIADDDFIVGNVVIAEEGEID